MNILRDEIRKCMSAPTVAADGTVSVALSFPGTFTGFQGHFPGRPVLPGVCLVQAALVALETQHKGSATLREISLAKFFSPVTPDMPFTLDVHAQAQPDGTLLAKASAYNAHGRISTLHLRVGHAHA